MNAATHLAMNQPGFLQGLDVLRGGLERDREGFGELTHGSLAACQFVKHPPASGVAQGVKDAVEQSRF